MLKFLASRVGVKPLSIFTVVDEMAAQLNGVRMKLEQRRKRIEDEKRKMEQVMDKQREKVGHQAFIRAVVKGVYLTNPTLYHFKLSTSYSCRLTNLVNRVLLGALGLLVPIQKLPSSRCNSNNNHVEAH